MEIIQGQKNRAVWRKCFLQFGSLDEYISYYCKNLPSNVTINGNTSWPIIKDISCQHINTITEKQSDISIDSKTKDSNKKNQSTTFASSIHTSN